MLRWCAIGLLLVLGWSTLFSQLSYLNRPGLLEKVNTGLNHTYNFAFEDARKIQQELLRATPDHPAPVFLEALILYWEHFPLLPEDQASDRFVQLMEQCVQMAETLIEQEETYLEGIFFDLFGRAFQAMFWADNGKSGKLVPDLRTMYKRTKEGFGLKEDFVEFYFSTGLYNYYIEAYPEAHPVYKPLLSFMQKGVPAILITRGFMGPDYHEPSDDPETINYQKGVHAARLTLGLAMEAANREVLTWGSGGGGQERSETNPGSRRILQHRVEIPKHLGTTCSAIGPLRGR